MVVARFAKVNIFCNPGRRNIGVTEDRRAKESHGDLFCIFFDMLSVALLINRTFFAPLCRCEIYLTFETASIPGGNFN